MVAEDKKKKLIEKSAQEFTKLSADDKMFILGYMLGVQQEHQKTNIGRPQTT